MIVTDTPDIGMSGARDTPSLGVRADSISSIARPLVAPCRTEAPAPHGGRLLDPHGSHRTSSQSSRRSALVADAEVSEVVAAASTRTGLPSAPGCATHPPRRYSRRVDQAHEGSRIAIAGAVPAGSTRAPGQKAFMDAVDAEPAFLHLRGDGYARLRSVARHMALRADWELLTTRPTWAVLATQAGCHVSTVNRCIRLLKRAGLVGVVATGRSRGCAPATLGRAEAAVYVLCVPTSPTLSAVPTTPVDEDDPPSLDVLSFKEHPPHTRGSERKKAGTRTECQTKTSPMHRWRPTSNTPRRPDERQAAAQALQDRFPVLRRVSTAHVASRIRDFILAGWSVADVGFAIDRRPDGTTWPHDGAHGVGNVGAWLRYRLAAWRDETGKVTLSTAQRDQARHELELARQLARREQLCADRAARSQMGSTVVSDALAQIRAALPWRWVYA